MGVLVYNKPIKQLKVIIRWQIIHRWQIKVTTGNLLLKLIMTFEAESTEENMLIGEGLYIWVSLLFW